MRRSNQIGCPLKFFIPSYALKTASTSAETLSQGVLQAFFTLFTNFTLSLIWHGIKPFALKNYSYANLQSFWGVFEGFPEFDQVFFKRVDEFVIITYICAYQGKLIAYALYIYHRTRNFFLRFITAVSSDTKAFKFSISMASFWNFLVRHVTIAFAWSINKRCISIGTLYQLYLCLH